MATCWNGAVAFDAAAVRANVSFRALDGGDAQSECYLFAIDLWRAGFGKIAMAPRARVAYELSIYVRARLDEHAYMAARRARRRFRDRDRGYGRSVVAGRRGDRLARSARSDPLDPAFQLESASRLGSRAS